MKKKVFFRVDGGESFGLGHLMRCISLAKSLITKSEDILLSFIGEQNLYISKKLKEEQMSFIGLDNCNNFSEFFAIVIQEKPKLIFIDANFSYSAEEINKLNTISKVVVFNNLSGSNLEAYCTIIPNAHRSDKELGKYSNISNFFCGLDYVLINSKILNLNIVNKEIIKNQIGITTGGSDPENVMLKLLHVLKSNKLKDKRIVAFYGENYMYKKELLDFIKHTNNKNIFALPYNIKKLFSSTLIISTFGVSSYELLYKSKPVINVGHSLFNTQCASILHQKYNCFVDDWGYVKNLDPQKCLNSIIDFFESEYKKQDYAIGEKGLVDGKGVERITDILIKIIENG